MPFPSIFIARVPGSTHVNTHPSRQCALLRTDRLWFLFILWRGWGRVDAHVLLRIPDCSLFELRADAFHASEVIETCTDRGLLVFELSDVRRTRCGAAEGAERAQGRGRSEREIQMSTLCISTTVQK